MIKVMKYLDENFFRVGDCGATLKSNGHYCVHGAWVYPKDWKPNTDLNSKEKDHMALVVNNEKIIVARICVNGEYCSKYHYLDTYEHIPRGLPDANGYYARSTDEEIIQYLDSYYQLIAKQRTRKRKLNKLNEIQT